jgi:hypothetical protein
MEMVGKIRVVSKEMCGCFCRFAHRCLSPCSLSIDQSETPHPMEEKSHGINPWVWGGPLIFIGLVLAGFFAFKVWVYWKERPFGGGIANPNYEENAEVVQLAGGGQESVQLAKGSVEFEDESSV